MPSIHSQNHQTWIDAGKHSVSRGMNKIVGTDTEQIHGFWREDGRAVPETASHTFPKMTWRYGKQTHIGCLDTKIVIMRQNHKCFRGKKVTELKDLSTEKHEQRRKPLNRSIEPGHSFKPPHVQFKCRKRPKNQKQTWRTYDQIFSKVHERRTLYTRMKMSKHTLFCTSNIY